MGGNLVAVDRSLPSSFSKRFFTGHTGFAGWNATIGTSVLNELRVRYNRFDDIRQSPQDQPANVNVRNTGNYFYNWRAADYVNRRSLGLTNNVSLIGTKHNVKLGVDYQYETDEWNYDAYRKPEIVFANKAAFFANLGCNKRLGNRRSLRCFDRAGRGRGNDVDGSRPSLDVSLRQVGNKVARACDARVDDEPHRARAFGEAKRQLGVIWSSD